MGDKLALVTGAAGFSAPYVIDELLKNNYRVRATDLPSASREHLKRFGDKIEFIPADLTKPETLKPLFDDVELLFHPAAVFSYSAPMELLRKVNVEGTKNLLDICLNSDVKKVVVWSSVAAYGSADPKFYDIPIKELPVEKLNPKINGRYDTSKREQEAAARKYWEENNLPISIMRPAPLYGPGSYYGIQTLFKYIEMEVLSVVPSNLARGKASIPLVHVEDVARAALFLSDPNRGKGESYNIVDDNTLDLMESIKLIAFLTGSKFKPIWPMPIKLLTPLLKLIGVWSKWEALHLRKKVNGKPPVPWLENDLLVYLDGNFWFSNEKIKKLGFEFKYPDRRVVLPKIIDWYNENGWEKKLALIGSDQMNIGKK